MSTQSKSVLIPFLIIAGIVFSVALAWKFLGNDDVKPTYEPVKVNTTTPVNTEKRTTPVETEKNTTAVVAPEADNNITQPVWVEPVVEDRETLRKHAKSNMRFAMRYPTLDKAISALEEFRNNGNNQAATDLIRYINTTFPNDTIPTNLLD